MNVPMMQNLSGYASQGCNAPAPGGPDCNYNIMANQSTYLPAQPIAQDPRMPILPNPNTITQLEEAKRRLEVGEEKFTSKMKQSRYVSLSWAFIFKTQNTIFRLMNYGLLFFQIIHGSVQ